MSITYEHIDIVWPTGKPYAQRHETEYRFQVTAYEAMQHVKNQLRLWGVYSAVVGTGLDILVRKREPAWSWPSAGRNPAIAVAINRHRQPPFTLALDKYAKPSANLRAIGLTIEAMRSIDRYGADEILGQMVKGLALPHPEDCWSILGVKPGCTRNDIKIRYRALAQRHHPDAGGTHAAFARIAQAYEEAMGHA